MNSIKRSGTADLLKGIAVIMMVQVHITEVLLKQNLYDSTFGHISLFLGGPPAAPVFMAVMGYFVFLSGKDIYDQIARGFLLFAGGIFLNIALNFHLLYDFYSGAVEINPEKFILGVDIFALAGMSITVLALMKHFFGRRLLPFIILSVIVLILTPIVNNSYFLPEYVQAFIGGRIAWSYFPLFPWLLYPLIGYIFAMIQKRNENPNSLFAYFSDRTVYLITAAIALILVLTFAYAYPISYDLDKYYHHEIMFTLWAMGFLAVFTFLADRLDNLAGDNFIFRYIKWVGYNVTPIYIVQWVLIGNIGTYIYKTSGYREHFGWFFVITVITSVLVYFYKSFRY